MSLHLPHPRSQRPAPVSKERKPIGYGHVLLLALLLISWLYSYDLWVLLFLVFTAAYIAFNRRVLPLAWHHRLAARLQALERPLRAFHIRLIRGIRPPAPHTATVTCLNCGTTFCGNYCPRCGQSRTTERYRIGNMLRNLAGGFFNIDSGFGRTVADLLYRPGYLMHDFIGGKRVAYFRPFQTLFVLAALYIMAVQLVDPGALKPSTSSTADPLAAIDSLLTADTTAVSADDKQVITLFSSAASRQMQSHAPAGQHLQQQLDDYFEAHPFLNNVWELLKSWAHGNKAFTILLTLPLFAIASRWAFRHRRFQPRYNLTEHIFIQTYIACQLLWVSILLLPFYGHASIGNLYEIPAGYIFALFCLDYKQLYRLSWKCSIRRTLLMFFYSLLLVIASATLVVGVSFTVVAAFFPDSIT